ncbi:hypothetical protein RKD37_002445 [Streptomyces ambofaciens]
MRLNRACGASTRSPTSTKFETTLLGRGAVRRPSTSFQNSRSQPKSAPKTSRWVRSVTYQATRSTSCRRSRFQLRCSSPACMAPSPPPSGPAYPGAASNTARSTSSASRRRAAGTATAGRSRPALRMLKWSMPPASSAVTRRWRLRARAAQAVAPSTSWARMCRLPTLTTRTLWPSPWRGGLRRPPMAQTTAAERTASTVDSDCFTAERSGTGTLRAIPRRAVVGTIVRYADTREPDSGLPEPTTRHSPSMPLPVPRRHH